MVNRALPVMSQAGFAIRAQFMLRRLRDTMLSLSEAQTKGDEVVMAVRQADELYADLEKLVKFTNLKSAGNAASLAWYHSTSQSVPINGSDQLTIMTLLADAIRYDEGITSMTSGVYEASSKVEYLNVLKPLPSCFRQVDVTQHRVKESHEQFLHVMRNLMTKERELRSMRQRLTLHQCGFLSHVIEAEFGRRQDPAFVAQVKATILIQYGQLSVIRMGAVGETLWTEQGDLEESAYEVYRLMGRFVTARLHNSSSTTRLVSMHIISTLLTFVQNFASAFSSPCCSCKKLMRDFLPPTRMVDFNSQRPVFQHEACQYLSVEGERSSTRR